MDKIKTIECLGKDNSKNQFELFTGSQNSELNKQYIVKHHSQDDFFELCIQNVGGKNYRVTSIQAHGIFYRGKGIPEILFNEVCYIDSIALTSGSNKIDFKKTENERRSLDATQMWKRLVDKNLAEYNQTEDIFYFKPY